MQLASQMQEVLPKAKLFGLQCLGSYFRAVVMGAHPKHLQPLLGWLVLWGGIWRCKTKI